MGHYHLLVEAHVSLHQTHLTNGNLEGLPADLVAAIRRLAPTSQYRSFVLFRPASS